jgi:predicted metal-binding membrane protein
VIDAARAGQTRGTAGRRVPPAVPVAIGAAWAISLLAQLTGKASLVHHGELAHSGLPVWVALGVFLVAWQVMIAAMMLPSSLPMIRLFSIVSANQERPQAATASFLGGYGVVWSVFGAVAFLGDMVLHRVVDSTPWLGTHAWVIAGGTLALAGAFQFSALKDKCLSECRHPGAFLLQHYRRGVDEAFRLGRRHGAFCLGCCWALMLVAFAAGVASLWWMAALGALMFYEKAGRYGDRVTPIAGWALLALAGLVFLHPPWVTGVLAG